MKDTQKSPIIYVDDSHEIRAAFVPTFNFHQIYPTQFSEPNSVVDYIVSNQIRHYILVTDFLMPELTGPELIHRLVNLNFPPEKSFIVSSLVPTEPKVVSALSALNEVAEVEFFEKMAMVSLVEKLQTILGSGKEEQNQADERQISKKLYAVNSI